MFIESKNVYMEGVMDVEQDRAASASVLSDSRKNERSSLCFPSKIGEAYALFYTMQIAVSSM